jgi:hypothetical protein
MKSRKVNFNEEQSTSENLKVNSPVGECCLFCNKLAHKAVSCKKLETSPVNKRWEWAKKKNICFICLEKRHRKDCPNKKPCGIGGCQKFHHQLLHNHKIDEISTKKDKLNATIKNSGGNICFKIIPIKIYGKDVCGNPKSVECNAFLDDGSAPTLITESLLKALNLTGPVEELCLGWTDGTRRTEQRSQNLMLEISGVGKYYKRFKLNGVHTVATTNLPAPTYSISGLKNKYNHLKNMDIPQPYNKRPLILIGEEHANLMVTLDYREGSWNEPIAARTRLGWTVHGGVSDEKMKGEPLLSCFMCDCKNDNELNNVMKDYFSQEEIVSNSQKKLLIGKDEKRSIEILQATSKNIGNRYEVGLLWKEDNIVLPDSKQMALKRLECFERQLKKDHVLRDATKLKINENVSKGFARKLTPDEANIITSKTWYLPIFVVKNPHKPAKIRLVYDAAAKVNNIP